MDKLCYGNKEIHLYFMVAFSPFKRELFSNYENRDTKKKLELVCQSFCILVKLFHCLYNYTAIAGYFRILNSYISVAGDCLMRKITLVYEYLH